MREVKPGDRFRVVGYEPGNQAYRQKLLAMGLTRGVLCEVIKVAPFGDPIQIRVRGYSLTLRRAESALLRIEAVP